MCDYCQRLALWLAVVETKRGGICRIACQDHVDRARADCHAMGTPNITEIKHPEGF